MKATKLSRIERCMSLLFEVQHFSRKQQKFNSVDLCNSNKIDTTILIDAVKMGFITKNGYGYHFNKPITPETVNELLDFNYNKKQEYKRKKAESDLIQKEIWTATLVPDVNFDDLKPQRINPITIDELISDMENLWVKFNEYAKIQKP